MGAWYCEGDGCDAVVPGAHPLERADGGRSEGWDSKTDAMLCRACTAERAFAAVKRWVVDHDLDMDHPELGDLLKTGLAAITRAASFDSES